MTRNGCVIIYHDRAIDDLEIGDLDYHQLQSIAKRKGFEIPLFEDILKLCLDDRAERLRQRIALDIEIKSKYIAAVITDRPELALEIVDRLDKSRSAT
jgi:glycerophosphoryl diester phosphodiesterase